MLLKKSVSLVLALSQVICMGAFADPAQAPATPSPEFTLVENVLALQGQKLSQSGLQNQISTTMSKYLTAASATGAQERLREALIQLGVYTPAQAQDFVADAQADAAKAAASSDSAGSYAQAMSSEMQQLAENHPAGAQFSASDLLHDGFTQCMTGGALFLLGAFGVGYGQSELDDNPTCTTPTETGTAYDPTTGQTSIVSIATGPTTCAKPGYYPHTRAGENYDIAGYTLLAVGGILLAIGWFNGSQCFDGYEY